MKILRKISLKRGLNRLQQPSPSYPKFYRYVFSQRHDVKLKPSQQLHKYGIKPPQMQLKWIISLLFGGTLAYIFKCYQQQLYQNELDTIYRYRYHQIQLSSVRLLLRILLFKIFHHLQNNYHLAGLMKSNKNELQQITEGYLRYEQYENYMRNKDRKYDFIDIGIMEKYPYAKPKPKME